MYAQHDTYMTRSVTCWAVAILACVTMGTTTGTPVVTDERNMIKDKSETSLAYDNPLTESFKNDSLATNKDTANDPQDNHDTSSDSTKSDPALTANEQLEYPTDEEIAELYKLNQLLELLETEAKNEEEPFLINDILVDGDFREIKDQDEKFVLKDEKIRSTHRKFEITPAGQSANGLAKDENNITRMKRSAGQGQAYLMTSENMNSRHQATRTKRELNGYRPDYLDPFDVTPVESRDESSDEDYLKKKVELDSERNLVDALLVQKAVEEGREAAIDDLISAILQGDVEISAPRKRSSTEDESNEEEYYPIVHNGVRGIFIPQARLARDAGASEGYQEEPWQAVVPNSEDRK